MITINSAPAPVILCADDYGYRPGVSAGIAELACCGRLGATGALVNFANWHDARGRLNELREQVDVGLHLNLVEGRPLGELKRLAPNGELPNIRRLIALALNRAIDPDEIRAETERQIEAFMAGHGTPPDFLDGHQHAHALPEITDTVLEVWRRAGFSGPLRAPADRPARILRRGVGKSKALIVTGLTRGFARRAHAQGIRVNDSFSGFYDFSPKADLKQYFSRFLTDRGHIPLIMCHPGHADASMNDDIAPARAAELAFLKSAAFEEILFEAGLRIERFSTLTR